MEIYERIRELRKKHLKMSMEVFGKHLGVSLDVISNIENNRLARPEQKMSLYKLICSEFNISEEWLLNGIGDMYANDEAEYSALIDQIMSGENEFAKNVFKTFTQFELDDWEALHRMIEKYNSVAGVGHVSIYDEAPDTEEELEKLYPPVDPGGKSDVG